MTITLRSAEIIGLRRRIKYTLDLTGCDVTAASSISGGLQLTQKHTLTVQSLSSISSIEVPQVSEAVFLVVNNLVSSSTIGNVGTFGMKHFLTVDNVNSSSAIGNVQLNPYTELVINNLLSSSKVDNTLLSLGRKPIKYWYQANLRVNI